MKKMHSLHGLNALSFTVFALSYAHVARAATLQDYIAEIITFINAILLPFFFAIALLMFLVNITRLFIIKSDDAASREKARTYTIYSVIALAFLISMIALVNIVLEAFDLQYGKPICPDYNPICTEVNVQPWQANQNITDDAPGKARLQQLESYSQSSYFINLDCIDEGNCN